MGSLNIDQNSWYQINATKASGQSLRGTVLYDDGLAGAVFFTFTNSSKDTQSWQFYPFNSTVYLVRCQAAGPDAYLGVRVSDRSSSGDDDNDDGSSNNGVLGDTVPYLAAYNISDDSMFWQTGLWSDGTVYLYNLANGSDWRMTVLDNSLMAMSSNITAPQKGEQFKYARVGAIDNEKWSTYSVSGCTWNACDVPFIEKSATRPKTRESGQREKKDLVLTRAIFPSQTYPATKTTAVAAASTTITTGAATGTDTDASDGSSSDSGGSSNGISTGAAAGIGVGIACLAILFAAAAVFMFLRKRKQKREAMALNVAAGGAEAVGGGGGDGASTHLNEVKYHDYPHGGYNSPLPHEMQGSRLAAEMPNNSYRPTTAPVELAGDHAYAAR